MLGVLFYLTFFLVFLFGGFLAFIGVPFRMAYLSPLVFLLMPFYGVRFDRVTRSVALFTIIIIVSGILNHMPLSKTLLFMRFVITSYAMYYLATRFITGKNIEKILRLMILIGMIQLPVIIFQRLFYSQLIQLTSLDIGPVDFNVGTFYIKDDQALSVFMMGLILFLIFDRQHNYFINNRYFKAAWFTITVLLSNSIISHLIVIGIWGYFFLRRLSLKTLLRIGFIGSVVFGTIFYLGYSQTWQELMLPALEQISFRSVGSEERFLQGDYSRAAAVLYYVNQPLKIFGDGPSRYYNPVTGKYQLGNTGQVFGFYAEIGLIGLLVGYWLLFKMGRTSKRTSRIIALPLFGCVSLLTITTSVLSDASIMLAYNIFLSTNMVPLTRHKSASVRQNPLAAEPS